jgi:hypothetical protein
MNDLASYRYHDNKPKIDRIRQVPETVRRPVKK